MRIKLQEKKRLLQETTDKICQNGYDETLVNELVSRHLDVYLAKEQQKIGDCVDEYLDAGYPERNTPKNTFAYVSKPGKGASLDSDVGEIFVHYLYHSLLGYIRSTEPLKKTFENRGLHKLNDLSCAQFWQSKVADALVDFDFEDLYYVAPYIRLQGSSYSYFICERDLSALLLEKGFSKENYYFDFDRGFGGSRFSDTSSCPDRPKGLLLFKRPNNSINVTK